jgi:rod shape-determining protein MreC
VLDIRQRTGYLFLAVMLGHVILISAQVQSNSGVRVLEAVTFGVFSRVQGAAASVIYGIRDVWGNYAGLRGARSENAMLRQQVADLEVRLQAQRALVSSTERLEALLGLQSSSTLPTLAARVIAGNPNPGVASITIARGSADGVQESMAVIAPGGVVGRVIGPVASHAARVQFLIDRTAAAGAVIERTRAGGLIVGGAVDPPLMMEMVSNLADVKTGDLVVASGVDGIFPKGFAIGHVASVERGPGLYLAITVRPTVNFSSIEEVLVVMVPPKPATPDVPEAGAPDARTAEGGR